MHIKQCYVSLGKYIGITGPLIIFPWSWNICSRGLCYVFIVDIQMELNQEFSGQKKKKDKTDIKAREACDSFWQFLDVVASLSQMSEWCNQKQSTFYDKCLGVNVAYKRYYSFSLFSSFPQKSSLACLNHWFSKEERKCIHIHTHIYPHRSWLL